VTTTMRSATKKKLGRNPKYLDWIREKPCLICERQDTPSTAEAAHVGERGLSQKCPDSEAIPLCVFHHREGPHAHHKLGKRFWVLYGIDKDAIIARLNAEYEAQR